MAKLTTKDFERAHMPFEWFVRYSQLSLKKQARFELLFHAKVDLFGQRFKKADGETQGARERLR